MGYSVSLTVHTSDVSVRTGSLFDDWDDADNLLTFPRYDQSADFVLVWPADSIVDGPVDLYRHHPCPLFPGGCL